MLIYQIKAGLQGVIKSVILHTLSETDKKKAKSASPTCQSTSPVSFNLLRLEILMFMLNSWIFFAEHETLGFCRHPPYQPVSVRVR